MGPGQDPHAEKDPLLEEIGGIVTEIEELLGTLRARIENPGRKP